MLRKIISGGQTGVDLAALDCAIYLGIAYGGWCPNGRINEDGIIPEKYNGLIELSGTFTQEKENYDTRTKYNVRDSDGTLLLVPTIPLPSTIQDSTLLTINEVKKLQKPILLIDLSRPLQENIEATIRWVKKEKIDLLNVAGPRESTCQGIYQQSIKFLQQVLPLL